MTRTTPGVPANLTFASGDTQKTFIFTATDDSADDDGERVQVGFGTLPAVATAGSTNEAVISITDDDVPTALTINFAQANYTVLEGSTVTVAVTLDEDPERTVVIPLTRMNEANASDSDYSGVPDSLTFNAGDTLQSFEVAAHEDRLRDGGEKVKLGFGNLPPGISAGTTSEATVTISDPAVQSIPPNVSFEQTGYTVAEGSTVEVQVDLSAAPGSDLIIPLVATNENDASDSDYGGVPGSLTFTAEDTEKTFTFAATQDADDDDGESVRLTFGTLPAGVNADANKDAATVHITDDDVPASVTVNFAQASYTVAEGSSVTVTVTLDDDPERQVVIPLTRTNEGGASDSDYSGVPASLTFASGDTEKTFTFTANSDSADDDGERVKVGFGTLPAVATAGSTNEAVISITDDDVPSVVASFAQASYTVAEGSSVTVTVELDAAPEREVIIPLVAANQDGATSADYGTLPTGVTFAATDTEKTFAFTATDDSADDDGESVRLTFGTLPAGVNADANKDAATVHITDDDVPTSVTVNFAQASYTVAEGSSVAVTVTLDDDPERQVVIPLTRTNEGGAGNSDYSGVPANLTFASGDTAKTFTFTANSDTATRSASDDGSTNERVDVPRWR